MLSGMAFIVMLSYVILSVIMLRFATLNVVTLSILYAECHNFYCYAECRYSKRCYAECCGT